MQTPRRRTTKSIALHAWIAEQILNFIADKKIQQGSRLAEERLAYYFRVSRTPVRSALTQLVAQGVVEKRHNLGYFVAVAPESISVGASVDGVERDYCRRLIEDRLSGLLPNRVTERVLLDQYGFTRAQLAEILLKLSHEDWIVRLPGKGWEFVPPLATKTANQHAYQCRILIEPAALLQRGFHLPETKLVELRNEQKAMLGDGQQRLSLVQVLRTAFQFHEAIVFAAGNPYFNDAIRGVGRQFEIQSRDPALGTGILTTIFHDHMQILDLIRTKQMEKASVLMKCHIYREQKLICNDSTVLSTSFSLE